MAGGLVKGKAGLVNGMTLWVELGREYPGKKTIFS
jgi:hypothetical protein